MSRVLALLVAAPLLLAACGKKAPPRPPIRAPRPAAAAPSPTATPSPVATPAAAPPGVPGQQIP